MDTEKLDQDAIWHLTYLGTLTDHIRSLEDSRARSVAQARDHGASWRMIGVALGTSTQAAWQRYNPHTPVAESTDTLPGDWSDDHELKDLELSPDDS